MQQLLTEQAATILHANREHAQGLLDALEQRHGGRLDKLESGAEKLAEGLRATQVMIAGKQHLCSVAGAGTPRRRRSLRSYCQALGGLDLQGKVSEDPFTTGPRKNIALMNCPLFDHESDGERRI